jgi:hypothetical protein
LHQGMMGHEGMGCRSKLSFTARNLLLAGGS